MVALMTMNSRRSGTQALKLVFAGVLLVSTTRLAFTLHNGATRDLAVVADSQITSVQTRPQNEKGATYKLHPQFSEEWMKDFILEAKKSDIRRKELQRKPLQLEKMKKHWPKPKNKLKVPTPIFVPSLPKSGTTTAHQYFECGGQKSAHLVARTEEGMAKIGRCAQRNVMRNRPPFEGCGDYNVWTDTGYVAARYKPGDREQLKGNVQCYYPLIDALDQVYSSYPNATFLFVVRETEGWLNSIQTYHESFIMDVWRHCRAKGFPGPRANVDDFRKFYEWHKDMIRNFAKEHPSWTYVEVDLESPEAGKILEEKIGIEAKCWGHYNHQGKDVKRVPKHRPTPITEVS